MPSYLWNQIKSWFNKAEVSSPVNPYMHEVIERTETEVSAFEKWENSLIKRQLLHWLHDQYAVFLTDVNKLDQQIDFLQTPSSNGFVIHFNETNYQAIEIICLFDHLRNKTLTKNYKNYLSDRRTYTRGDSVESKERHYLKPPRPDFSSPKINQLFGNVTIELLFKNDHIIHLKYSATHYTDHKYLPPDPFEHLMRTLTQL